MLNLTVDVQVACDDASILGDEDIQSWVHAAVQHERDEGDIEVAVRVVGTDEIRTMNREYRDQDKATNVLSFPAGNVAGLPAEARRSLGDIVVCAAVIAAEAREQGKRLEDHWGHMLVHGALHLLGYDHQTDAEAAEMEGVETTILAARNVTDPYAGP